MNQPALAQVYPDCPECALALGAGGSGLLQQDLDIVEYTDSLHSP